MKIKDAKDFWSGVMFSAFGLFFVVFAQQYDMGTAARMGPAYFPTVLGGLMLLLGILIIFKGLKTDGGEDGKVSAFHFKPLLLVLGAVIAFGLLLRPLGLLVSLTVLIVVSSLGSPEFRLRDALLLTVGLSILCVVVFINSLGMTIPVLPAFMRD